MHQIILHIVWFSGSDVANSNIRLQAKNGPAPPPPPKESFADISLPKENFKLHRIRDVCTLCDGALVSDSMLHMLPYKIKKKSKMNV